MRRIDPGPADGARGAMTAARLLALAAALPLVACGSDTAPPLTGNLVDARGAHAGSFRSADASPLENGADNGAQPTAAPPANTQDTPR